MSNPKTSEEALAHIKAAAESGDITFASDNFCAQLDDEIQEIFTTLRITERGQPPRRNIWTSDGSRIDSVFDANTDQVACMRQVSEKLGVEIKPTDLWEDAAMRLRSHRAASGSKS